MAAWIAAVYAASRFAIAASGRRELAGICAGALGPAPVLLGGDLRPLAPAILYRLDSRSERQRQQLEKLTGRPVSADHAVPRLHWWRENHPELWDRTRTVVDMTGALVCAFTGRAVLDSVTGSEYYDLDGSPADSDLRLAGRCEPTSAAGTLSSAAADRLGVGPGAPVLAGSIDSFLDLFAAGVRCPGDGGIVAGSTAVVALASSSELRPQARAANLEVSAYLGAGWLALDWTGAAGSALDWAGGLLGGRQELDQLAAALPAGLRCTARSWTRSPSRSRGSRAAARARRAIQRSGTPGEARSGARRSPRPWLIPSAPLSRSRPGPAGSRPRRSPGRWCSADRRFSGAGRSSPTP